MFVGWIWANFVNSVRPLARPLQIIWEDRPVTLVGMRALNGLLGSLVGAGLLYKLQAY